MKVVDAALDAHYQGTVTSTTMCWKIKRTDEVIITATELDKDIPFDLVDDGEGDGELIYLSDSGINRSALEATADFKVGNMELQGIIDSSIVTVEDIRAGLYDFARVWIFQVNWKDLTQKELKLETGFLGQISLNNDIYVAEFRDLLELFLNEIGSIVTEECIVDLFDGKCRVVEVPSNWAPTTAYTETNSLDANVGDYVSPTGTSDKDRIFRCTVAGTSDGSEPTWNLTIGGTTIEAGGVEWTTVQANQVAATVDVVTSRSEFTITTSPTTDAPDIHFQEGTILFTSGPNGNLVNRNEIKSWDLATRKLILALPLPFDITSGETLTLSAGCTKSTARCNTYLNIYNYRGWPHVPGTNKLLVSP